MLIDGEKWACEACVRGHRVSNCQHHDRPLHHINKKGRPVSQCTHCRTLRKSRSAHVKCDCGDRSHSRGHCSHKGDKDHSACTCSHGGKCICSLKKEPHLTPIPEIGKGSKPRLTSANSDSSLSHFANGIHKSYKQSYLGRGTPYSIPRSHTISGYTLPAQRSTDSLPSTNTMSGPGSYSQIKETFARPQDVRLVRSEHGSPHSSAISSLDGLDAHMAPLDLPYPAYHTASANRPPPLDMTNVSVAGLEHFVGTPDSDHAMYSSDLTGPAIDWSTFDLQYDGGHQTIPTSAPFTSQPNSYPPFDQSSFLAHRAMTAPSTGDASDVEEFPVFDPSPVHPPSLVHTQFASDSSDLGDTESFHPQRLAPAQAYMNLGPTAMLTTNNLQSLDLEDFIKGASSAVAFDARSSVGPDTASVASVHSASQIVGTTAGYDQIKFAPTSAPSGVSANFALPVTSSDSAAPYWVPRYESVSASLSPENEPPADKTVTAAAAAQTVWAN